MIELKDIDTPVAAKNFAELLESKKTYFLDGEWGSGKTEFINKVKKQSDKTIISLDLWNVKDERTVINIAFSKLHPFVFWAAKVLVVLAVVVFIFMTSSLYSGFLNISPKWLLLSGGVVAIFVSVWQVFKKNSDDFYRFVLRKSCYCDKVLLLDDFDRVSEDKQKEAYKLFNLLNGKLPIVFLGNFEKIVKNEDNYLQKIIDQRVELPIVLNAQEIWKKYITQLEKDFEFTSSDAFRKIFEMENRNLRERKQFNDLVNQEFFDKSKLGRVQPEQQLVVIYIYLFLPKVYKVLLANRLPKTSDVYTEFLNTPEDKRWPEILNLKHETVNDYLYDLLQRNQDYPKNFLQNREGYFLYEFVPNLTIKEAEGILHNQDKIREHFRQDNYQADFFSYLSRNFDSLEDDMKNKLLVISLELIKEGRDSGSLVTFLINNKSRKGIDAKTFSNVNMKDSWAIITGSSAWSKDSQGKDINITKETLKRGWDNILEKQGFDLSLKMYFYKEFCSFNFTELGKLYENLDLSSDDFKNGIRKDMYLLVYLTQNGLWIENEKSDYSSWSEELWQIINELSEEQFINFWIIQGSAEQENLSRKNYAILNSEIILPHIKPKLDGLKKSGYTFNNV